MHTLHPHMYPVSRLLEDHQVIANMHPDTAKRIEEIIAKHPDRPMPYFWRGLRHEAAGQLPDALADYVRAANLAPYNQWQPYYRLYCVNTTLGRVIAARDAAEECVKRQPQWESLLGVTNVFCAQPTAP
jgi:tetratricopeptide (TPR) repeat protein